MNRRVFMRSLGIRAASAIFVPCAITAEAKALSLLDITQMQRNMIISQMKLPISWGMIFKKLNCLKPENFGKVTWVSYESVEYRWAISESAEYKVA